MSDQQTVKNFDINGILESVGIFSSLNKQQKQTLAKSLLPKIFNKGEDIMREGEEGDSFYIIVKGKVEVKSKQGGHLAYISDGDYAGEQALIKNATRNATLTALDHTITLVCKKKLFDEVLGSSVKFAKREGKRRAILTTMQEDHKLPEVEEKPKETIEWILDCVNDNLLFLKLDRYQRERVVKRMRLISATKGTELIKQGDTNAQTFYVCDQGTFDILVDGVKVGEYKRGGCFGELALLYDSPRAATILATSDSKVWEVSRDAFRYEVAHAAKDKSDETVEFIKKIEIFKPLLSQELLLIADALEENLYKQNDVIINEGEEGDKFYVIKSGTVTWSKSNGEHGELNEKLFFGERALRTKEKRAATITAKTNVVCLEMTSKDFTELLGPIVDIIDDKIEGYKRLTQSFLSEEERKEKESKQKKEQESGYEEFLREKENISDINELINIGVLGKGAFGLVSLVEDPKTKKSYALKAIKKHQIIQLGQQAHIISEKRVMEKMHNKFLVNLHRTYKDKLRVYFLLDACLGGELFTILRQRRYFDEPTAKFYTACVVEAFAYMHSKDIIYRDLKPENLVLDTGGYLKVTDFGFAKEVPDKTFTLCGTPDYLAPEIVTGQGHGRAVDWWTLGVLIYEMLASFPPFFDDEPIETYRKIIKGKVKFPRYFSTEARDLIRGLLRSKPTKRLGILKGGADNIRKHEWFIGFDWNDLRSGKTKAPIINKVRDHKDLSNFVNNEDDENDEEALPVDAKDDFGDEF